MEAMLKGKIGKEAWIIYGLMFILTVHARSKELISSPSPIGGKFLEKEEVMDIDGKGPSFLLQLLQTCASPRWASFSIMVLSSIELHKLQQRMVSLESAFLSTHGPTHSPNLASTHTSCVPHSLPCTRTIYSSLAPSVISSSKPKNIHTPQHPTTPKLRHLIQTSSILLPSPTLAPTVVHVKHHHRKRNMASLVSEAPLSSKRPCTNHPQGTTKISSIFSPLLSPSVLPPSSSDSPSANSPSTLARSGCCSSNKVRRPGLPRGNCSCVYPIKMELMVSNVSTTFGNWSAELQQQLASQLNLSAIQIKITSFHFSETNLSLVINLVPLINDSFSSGEANIIKSDLESYSVHLNSSLFGNYTIHYFQYFEPPKTPVGFVNSTPALPVFPSSHILPHTISDSLGRSENHDVGFILGIVAASFIFLSVLVIVVWKYVASCCVNAENVRHKERGLASSRGTSNPIEIASFGDSLPWPSATRFFSFKDLQEATCNFESENLLGEGGSGRVYKGVLKDGTAVAIKRLTCGNQQGDKEFLVEVEMLSHLHHRNVVKLIGYHLNHDSSQHLLCYELVPNGSLEAWLHGPSGENRPLDWDTRMQVALDAARGLAYLHEDSQPCVIHRDFKASNILLENDFHAKVADFGLAKHAPKGPNNFFSTRVMGTYGYVAPEYAMTGRLLVKSDVYSYGVVLFELLSGRKPVDMSKSPGQENLVTWACSIVQVKERIRELEDPRLCGKLHVEEFSQVASIAAACVAPEASERPMMGEVVQLLMMVRKSSGYGLSRDGKSSSIIPMPLSSTSKSTRKTSALFESGACSYPPPSSDPFMDIASALDNEILSQVPVFSEDLQEGR